MLRVRIKQSSDHSLVLRVVFARLVLEEFDAALAERDGHLHTIFTEDQIFRTRQKVRYNPEFSERLIGVSDFLAHRSAFLSANSRLRGCE